jgi:hypoxanthine phosphoribosyltransferase
MHTDAAKAGDRIVLIDDLIATGGTMMAGRRLLERLGATHLPQRWVEDGRFITSAGCRPASTWRWRWSPG